MTNNDSRLAIYPGSFDPITFGHVDVIKRAIKLFDHVTIAVIQNPSKQSLFTLDERIILIQQAFDSYPNISVEGFEGLLVNYAERKNVFTIIRGLRAVSDFDFEFQMALTNRKLHEEIDTIFLMTDENHSYLSSSVVKEVAQFGGDISSFVTPEVEKRVKEKIKNE